MDDSTGGQAKGQFSVLLPPELVAKLDVIAERRLSKRATLIREAIVEWLRRQEAAEAV